MWDRIIVHADMDAFYAAVEQRDHPQLRGKPVLIGPNSWRGVVLTASYEARPYRVGSGMPVSEARRRCPHAIMVPPRFERYEAVSREVMSVLEDFSPAVEALSLDEAFLDMTGASHLFGEPREMGRMIKAAVFNATGLHISVGISSTKYVAKVASAHEKPDGLTVVPADAAREWLRPLPVTRLWGVGPRTAPRMVDLGFERIGDIQLAGESAMRAHFGEAGAHFFGLSMARDPRAVRRGARSRSIGSDRTLNRDVSAPSEIETHLRRSAERIARRLRQKTYVARGVRVRLKTTGFRMLTRQRRLPSAVDTADALFAAARQLLPAFGDAGPFRLVGMAAFDLDWCNQPAQFDLFDRPERRELEATVDRLIARFGRDVVVRARDLGTADTVHRDGVNLDFLDWRDDERVSAPAGAQRPTVRGD